MVRSTMQVFEAHMGALARGDVTALMADYADDAVLMAIDKVYTGKAEIQAYFTGMYAAMPNMVLEGTGIQVHGDTVLVAWKGDCDTLTFPAGNDTIIIRDDKIRLQTVCFTAVPK
jgi:ketosteroid isomerase-like protein